MAEVDPRVVINDLWRTIGWVVAGWQTPEERAAMKQLAQAGINEGWPFPRDVVVPVLVRHSRVHLRELADELRRSATDGEYLDQIAGQLFVWFYLEAPAESRALCIEWLALLGYVIALTDAGPELLPIEPPPTDPEPAWVQLIRTDRVALFCVLCGGDLGPQPVQALVMLPESPYPTCLGHACADCLRLDPSALAAAIEAHANWLTRTSADLQRVAQLAGNGSLARPTYAELGAANRAARTDLDFPGSR